MRKFWIQLPIIAVLCGGIVFTAYSFSSKDATSVAHLSVDYEKDTAPAQVLEEFTTVPETTTSNSFDITLSFIGDCLCATDEFTNYANCFNDVADREEPSYFLEKVSSYFLNDDFTVGDCENVFSDSNNLKVRDKGQYDNPDIEAYWFKSAAKNANILSVGGIDCVSISNNHINDYGSQGYEDTKAALDNAGILWGEEGKIVYYEKNGYKIAVICVSMYGSGVVPNIIEYIEDADKESDYQIIYFHGGTEAIHEPEEWKKQACRTLADAGADLIMGDHPHVLQPLEKYNGVTIIYSLGNFIFGGNRHPENRTIIYQHTLTITEGKLKIQSGKIIPCYVYTGDTNNWQPAVIEDEEHKNKVLEFMNWESDSPL